MISLMFVLIGINLGECLKCYNCIEYENTTQLLLNCYKNTKESTESCDSNTKECFIYVLEKIKIAYRGCMDDTYQSCLNHKKENPNVKCLKCSTDLCNGENDIVDKNGDKNDKKNGDKKNGDKNNTASINIGVAAWCIILFALHILVN